MKFTKSDIAKICVMPIAWLILFVGVAIFLPDEYKQVNTEKTVSEINESDFVPAMHRVYKDGDFISIFIDDQNVMYFHYDLTADSGGACMMVNQDGTPRLWSEEDNDKEILEKLEVQNDYRIYKDTKTNVLYICMDDLMVMRNADGSVKLYNQ